MLPSTSWLARWLFSIGLGNTQLSILWQIALQHLHCGWNIRIAGRRGSFARRHRTYAHPHLSQKRNKHFCGPVWNTHVRCPPDDDTVDGFSMRVKSHHLATQFELRPHTPDAHTLGGCWWRRLEVFQVLYGYIWNTFDGLLYRVETKSESESTIILPNKMTPAERMFILLWRTVCILYWISVLLFNQPTDVGEEWLYLGHNNLIHYFHSHRERSAIWE